MSEAKTNTLPDSAMVLAAGLGKRMQSFSSDVPKPMVEVAGISLINRVLDKLNSAGIEKAVVNLHHKASMLEEHLTQRNTGPEIVISYEKDALLETGGGVKNALPLLGNKPFYVINSDALWHDGASSSLHALAKSWVDGQMDALLLLINTNKLDSYSGNGDFYMDDNGALSRPNDGIEKPYVFTGVQIINPAIFNEFEKGVFSLNAVYDKAALTGRLFGVAHSGMWHHVGSGDEVEIAEKFYSKK